jgi:hypothetical protein
MLASSLSASPCNFLRILKKYQANYQASLELIIQELKKGAIMDFLNERQKLHVVISPYTTDHTKIAPI